MSNPTTRNDARLTGRIAGELASAVWRYRKQISISIALVIAAKLSTVLLIPLALKHIVDRHRPAGTVLFNETIAYNIAYGLAEGFQAHMSKPVSPPELIAEIKRLARRFVYIRLKHPRARSGDRRHAAFAQPACDAPRP